MALIEAKEFILDLDNDWNQVESPEPDRVLVESKERRTAIVASFQLANLPRDKLLEAAEAFARARRDAEERAREGRVTFGQSWVELKEAGELGHVAYAGYDDRCIFRFMGWTTQRKFLSLWVSTETRDNSFSKTVFDEVFGSFKFYIP